MRLLIVTGPPGAGKSTVASLLVAQLERSVLVSGDAFFAFLREGQIAPWRKEAHPQNTIVTNAAAAATGAFVVGGFATVYDGVMGMWFLPEFVAAAGLNEIDYAVLLPSVETCVQRVVARTNHGFSDLDATRHMHEQFHNAIVDERHVFADDLASPEQLSDAIREEAESGRLRFAV